MKPLLAAMLFAALLSSCKAPITTTVQPKVAQKAPEPIKRQAVSLAELRMCNRRTEVHDPDIQKPQKEDPAEARRELNKALETTAARKLASLQLGETGYVNGWYLMSVDGKVYAGEDLPISDSPSHVGDTSIFIRRVRDGVEVDCDLEVPVWISKDYDTSYAFPVVGTFRSKLRRQPE